MVQVGGIKKIVFLSIYIFVIPTFTSCKHDRKYNIEMFRDNNNTKSSNVNCENDNFQRDYSQAISERSACIAVLDTKLNKNYDAISEKLWKNENIDINENKKNKYSYDYFGWNYIENNNNIFSMDSITHATIINKIIIDNMYKYDKNNNFTIMNLVVYDEEKNGIDISDIVNAIYYAEKNGAKICCLCINFYEYNVELYNAIKESRMLFIVSAGNDGVEIKDNDNFPTCYGLDNVISVASSTEDGKLSRNSNYGDYVDFAAPGDNITVDLEEKMLVSGTSYAVPFVASCATLIYTKTKNEISSIEIKKIICNSIKKTSLKVKNEGIIDIDETMQYFLKKEL